MTTTIGWENDRAYQVDMGQPWQPALAIALDDTDSQLSWSGHAAICQYEVYRNTAPYFTPDSSLQIATTTSTVISDTPPSLPIPYYYVVRPVSCTGQLQALDRVGRFPFDIIPGD